MNDALLTNPAVSPPPDADASQRGPARRETSSAARKGAARQEGYMERLRPYLKPDAKVHDGTYPESAIPWFTEGMHANAHYFSHPRWMDDWLAFVHRYPELRDRWLGVLGTLDGKVLVDVGCGPGNLLATLGGKPLIAIGVDIATGSLERAASVGYVPLRADGHDMPLRSGIADVVAINGSLHHLDDMRRALIEAARLVRPGGYLILDHDPQQSAWDFRGIALLAWRMRLPIYRWLKRGGHTAADDEQIWALATELHHRPGDGLTRELVNSTLRPLGFDIQIYPHSHYVGREVMTGTMGRPPLKIRLAQRLSGIDPNSPAAALSLFCVARKPL
ncbi:class I SAM-dependent methyltransferase [Cupriavidus sp. AU9028]|uniref:class I SAM-dependent methyltransferase n=1 Tax=Cupriavidus sp. AU9028 TaxID=2871157 RepID=UPI0021075366|nr:class I SAM-dependent methyltransferase [Cupriavidus sp. AU9028]